MSNGSRESAQDLAFERIIERTLRLRKNPVELYKLPQFSPADFLAVRDGRVVAIIECRTRDALYSQYPSLFFGVEKHRRLMALSEAFGRVPVKLFVSFKGAAYQLTLPESPEWEQTEGSRGPVDVPRVTDNELVWLIPIGEFQSFELVTERVEGI